jgi:hypothetical protein
LGIRAGNSKQVLRVVKRHLHSLTSERSENLKFARRLKISEAIYNSYLLWCMDEVRVGAGPCALRGNSEGGASARTPSCEQKDFTTPKDEVDGEEGIELFDARGEATNNSLSGKTGDDVPQQ